jgi:hypothetical protein
MLLLRPLAAGLLAFDLPFPLAILLLLLLLPPIALPTAPCLVPVPC